MSGRCASCNNVLKEGEGRWNEVLQEHDDFCGSCNKQVDQDEFQVWERSTIPTGDVIIDSGVLS